MSRGRQLEESSSFDMEKMLEFLLYHTKIMPLIDKSHGRINLQNHVPMVRKGTTSLAVDTKNGWGQQAQPVTRGKSQLSTVKSPWREKYGTMESKTSARTKRDLERDV